MSSEVGLVIVKGLGGSSAREDGKKRMKKQYGQQVDRGTERNDPEDPKELPRESSSL